MQLAPLRVLSVDMCVPFCFCSRYLGGHSDLLAGVVSSHDHAFMRDLGKAQKLFGGTLPAFDSFLISRGVKTLAVRLQHQNAVAEGVAAWLEAHPLVEAVHYPGLASHPQHELAKRQMVRGFGAMLSFDVKASEQLSAEQVGKRFVESLRHITLAVSLGGSEALCEHPASMTHVMIPRPQRLEAGE